MSGVPEDHRERDWVERFARGGQVTVPWEFARQLVEDWSWPEVRLGLVYGYASADFARAVAEVRLQGGDETALEPLLLDSDLDVALWVDAAAPQGRVPGDPRAPWVPVVMEWVRQGHHEPGWWPAASDDSPSRWDVLWSAGSGLDYPPALRFLWPAAESLPTWACFVPDALLTRWRRRTVDSEAAWLAVDQRLAVWVREECQRLRQREIS